MQERRQDLCRNQKGCVTRKLSSRHSRTDAQMNSQSPCSMHRACTGSSKRSLNMEKGYELTNELSVIDTCCQRKDGFSQWSLSGYLNHTSGQAWPKHGEVNGICELLLYFVIFWHFFCVCVSILCLCTSAYYGKNKTTPFAKSPMGHEGQWIPGRCGG